MQRQSEEPILKIDDAVQLLSTVLEHVERLSVDCHNSLCMIHRAICLFSISLPQETHGPTRSANEQGLYQLDMPFIHNPGASESLPPPWESLPTVQASDQQELLSLATKLYYADPSSGQNMSEFSTPVLQQAYPMTRLPDELGYDTASFSSSDQAASSEFSETASMSTIRSASSEQVPGSTFRPSSPAKLAPPLNPTNPLQCHQCDQIIKNPANLRRHLRTVHQPGVRHPCTRCRKTLSRGDALKRHMKSHCP